MTTAKLSAKDLAFYALRAMAGRFGVLVSLCAPSLLILVLAAAAGRVLTPEAPPDAEPAEAVAASLRFLAIGTFIATLALVPAFTGWHRLLVRGDARREDGRLYGWDLREWRYLGRLVLIWVAMTGVNIFANILIAALGGTVFALVLAGMAALALYLMIWAQLGLALPAAALGRPIGFAAAIRMAAGEAGRIAAGLAVVWALLGLAGGVLVLALSAFGSLIGSSYIVVVGVIVIYYIGLVASVGVLSRAYALLAD